MDKIVFFHIILLVANCESSYDIVDVITHSEIRPPNYKSDEDFGFSLALFDGKIGSEARRILIGAPNAETDQEFLDHPGAVYSCSISKNSECFQLPVDTRSENATYSSAIKKEFRSNSRIGTTVISKEDNVVVCAPKWSYFVKLYGTPYTYPVGICYSSTDSTLKHFKYFAPAVDAMAYQRNGTRVSAGSFLVGFSADYSKDDTLLFGGPAAFHFLGSAWETHKSGELKSVYSNVLTKGQMEPDFTQNSNEKIPEQVYKYGGYSIASGTFGGNSGFASSMPLTYFYKDDNGATVLTGPVVSLVTLKNSVFRVWEVLHPPKITISDKMSNDEELWMFSYFGASITVVDINGDNLDDVIVGAPQFKNGRSGNAIETGAFVVYNQLNSDKKVEFARFVEGFTKYSRFGTSITSIGDIDLDGFQDIAVGAPYDQDGDNIGAVYIYRGGKMGISDKYDQKIEGYLSSFGRTVASNFKIFEGKRNDLAIGAPEKDFVYILRSKQIISVEFNVNFASEFTLEDLCTEHPNLDKQCKSLRVCAKYVLQGEKSKFYKELDEPFKIEVNLDITEDRRGLSFKDGKKIKIFSIKPQYQSTHKCEEEEVITSKLEVDISIDYYLNIELKLPFAQEIIYLKKEDPVMKNKTLTITRKCKGDCSTEVQLTLIKTKDYDLSSNDLKIDVELQTFTGDILFHPKLQLDTSGDLTINNIESLDGYNCDHPLNCTLGLYLLASSKIQFTLTLVPTKEFQESLKKHKNSFTISATVSSNHDLTGKTTNVLNVPIIVDPKLEVYSGQSNPDIKYDENDKVPSAAKNLLEIGDELNQEYIIINKNEYPIFSLHVFLYIPIKIKDNYFTYIEGPPQFTDTWSDCNYWGTKVDEFGLSSHNSDVNNTQTSSEEAELPEKFMKSLEEDLKTEGRWLKYHCVIGSLHDLEQRIMKIKLRFVSKTLYKLKLDEVKKIPTFVEVKFGELPLGTSIEDFVADAQNSISINYSDGYPPKLFWWEILLIVLGALILLALIIFILYKIGFFKRLDKKNIDPKEEAETDPMINENKTEGEDIKKNSDEEKGRKLPDKEDSTAK